MPTHTHTQGKLNKGETGCTFCTEERSGGGDIVISPCGRQIKAHFDGTLSLIEANGSDEALRNQVSNAQSLLHEYERNYVAKIVNLEKVQHLQIAIQNSISMINSKIYGSEG